METVEFIDVVKQINTNLSQNYKFKLDILRDRVVTKELVYISVYDKELNSIKLDNTWFTNDFRNMYFFGNQKTRESLEYFRYWVNTKLFTNMINVAVNNNLQYNTHLVRLNIANNMLDKFDFFLKEEIEEQQYLLKDTYYARNLAICRYYEEFVAKIPF